MGINEEALILIFKKYNEKLNEQDDRIFELQQAVADLSERIVKLEQQQTVTSLPVNPLFKSELS